MIIEKVKIGVGKIKGSRSIEIKTRRR